MILIQTINILTYLIAGLAAIVTGVFGICGITITAFLNSLNNLRLEETKNNYLLENDKIRNDYQKEIEKLKTALAAEKDKSHFKFTKFHENQLEAIKKIYAGLIEIENAACLVDNKLYYSDNTNEELEKRLQAFLKSLSYTARVFRKNAIFLNKNTKSQIQVLLNNFGDFYQIVNQLLIAKKQNDRDLEISLLKEKSDSSVRLNEIIPGLKDSLEKNLEETLQAM